VVEALKQKPQRKSVWHWILGDSVFKVEFKIERTKTAYLKHKTNVNFYYFSNQDYNHTKFVCDMRTI
jgi:hypothetical protein